MEEGEGWEGGGYKTQTVKGLLGSLVVLVGFIFGTGLEMRSGVVVVDIVCVLCVWVRLRDIEGWNVERGG